MKKKNKSYETLKLNSKYFQVRGRNLYTLEKNNKINSCLSI